MDLRAEATRLSLDTTAVALSGALVSAGVPHAVIKGPSTSLWLYAPPRPYRDVDLLVPVTRVADLETVLADAGLARRAAGGVGEEAQHSLLLRSAEGHEVDVHVSLPCLPVTGDLIWDAVSPRLTTLDLGVGAVPVLDLPGRCVVLALHAVGEGSAAGQPLEDLRRARAACDPTVWAEAASIARDIDAEDLLDAALALADGRADTARLSPRARLFVTGAPPAAFGLARIARARGRERLTMVARELVPSEGFLRFVEPDLAAGRRALVGAHLRRWRRLSRQMPDAVRAIRRTRRG